MADRLEDLLLKEGAEEGAPLGGTRGKKPRREQEKASLGDRARRFVVLSGPLGTGNVSLVGGLRLRCLPELLLGRYFRRQPRTGEEP